MKQQDFLFRQPAIKMVNAESRDIATTSTGKCSTTLTTKFYLPPFFFLFGFEVKKDHIQKTIQYAFKTHNM